MEIFRFEKEEEPRYLTEQLITYIGNKRKLLQFIKSVIDPIQEKFDRKLTMLDGFAGSGVVSRFFKKYSKTLHSNDIEHYASIIGSCYLSNQNERPAGIAEAVDRLNRDSLRKDLGTGLIETLYSPKDDEDIQEGERVFYTNRNAKIIDNVRRTIDEYPEELRAYLLAPLLQKASVHANTSGVFKGFYKNTETNIGQFGGTGKDALSRITKDIVLAVPPASNFDCEWIMYQQDINVLVQSLPEVDVAYFDPPYNQHPYGSNYFMLNVIADYKKPETISKVSGIPENWNKSNYNKKKEAYASFDSLIRDTKASYIVISYNDEGFLSATDAIAIFEKYGTVSLHEQDYATFKGSRNLAGRSKNVKELLFVIKKTGS